MSNFCATRCFTCGRVLSKIYKLYQLLKKNTLKGNPTHIHNINVDPSRHESTDKILTAIGLTDNHLCCRKHMLTTTTPLDLEMMNMHE